MKSSSNWLLSCVVLFFAFWAQRAGGVEGYAGLRFEQPAGDLIRIRVGSRRVVFLPNGSFVVECGGVYLMDGGLTYAVPGYKEWGDQIRRSLDSDTYQLHPSGRYLRFRSTVQNITREDALHVEQSVTIRPSGLLFDYEIAPAKKLALQVLGAVFHLPVRVYSPSQPDAAAIPVEFCPGFQLRSFPLVLGAARFQQMPRARTAIIARRDAHRRIVIRSAGPASWQMMDDRQYNLNTHRAILSTPVPRAVDTSFRTRFSFELSFQHFAERFRARLDPADLCFSHDGSLGLFSKHGEALAEGALSITPAAEPVKLLQWDYGHGAGRAERVDGQRRFRFDGAFSSEHLEAVVPYEQGVVLKDDGAVITYSVLPAALNGIKNLGFQLAGLRKRFDVDGARLLEGDDDQLQETEVKWGQETAARSIVLRAEGLSLKMQTSRGATWRPQQSRNAAEPHELLISTELDVSNVDPKDEEPVRFVIEIDLSKPRAEAEEAKQ